MSEPKHTHYSPYGSPQQVEGTLLDCTPEYPEYHKLDGSELWADYHYSPRVGPESDTGLPPEMERAVIAAYMEHKRADVQWRIVDVTADPEYTYRVKITNRTAYNGDGPDWHTVEYGLHTDGTWKSTYNPHPPYVHEPPFCANCGW